MALDVGTRGGHSARQGRSFARGLRPEYLGPHGDWAVGVDWVAQVLALTLLKAERAIPWFLIGLLKVAGSFWWECGKSSERHLHRKLREGTFTVYLQKEIADSEVNMNLSMGGLSIYGSSYVEAWSSLEGCTSS